MWTFLQIIPVVFKELSDGLLSNISDNSSAGKLLWDAGNSEVSLGKLIIPLDILCLVSHSAVFR
jgi:hypothetical protein